MSKTKTRKITVTFTDGDVHEFNIPTYADGQPNWLSTQAEEMIDTIKDYAGSQVFPSKIEDDTGEHYYCEWDVNIIPCPGNKIPSDIAGTMPADLGDSWGKSAGT